MKFIYALFLFAALITQSVGQQVSDSDHSSTSVFMENDSHDVTSKPIFPNCESKEMEVSEACSESSLIHFIQSEMNCPPITKEEVPTSRIIFNLFIDKEGNVSKIKVVKGEDHPCRNSLEKVSKKIPQMIPAKKSGVPVEYVYTIPLHIRYK